MMVSFMWSNEFLATESVTFASIGSRTNKRYETEKKTEEAADYGGGLYAREPQGCPDGGDIRAKKVYDRKRLKRAGIKLNDDLPFRK